MCIFIFMFFWICVLNLKTYIPIDISGHFRTFQTIPKMTTCKCVLQMFLLSKISRYVHHFSKTSRKKHKITIYDWSQKNHVFSEKHRKCTYWKNNNVCFHILNCPELNGFQPWISQNKTKIRKFTTMFPNPKKYIFFFVSSVWSGTTTPPPRLVTNFSKKSKSQKNKSQWGGPKKDSKKWDSDVEWDIRVNC